VAVPVNYLYKAKLVNFPVQSRLANSHVVQPYLVLLNC
jgi:hypothetical protein